MTEETKSMEIEKQEALPAEGTERTRECPCFVPRADIYRRNEVIVVVVDMPGVASESIDVTLEKNVLTINGTLTPHRPEGHSLVWAEYEDGDYLRRFTVSDQIDREGIEATVRDGVLRLHLPIADAAKTRKISVKAG
jgi:HSP20 family protein